MATQYTMVPAMAAVALAFKNPDLSMIADDVCVRVPVSSQAFSYNQFTEGEMFKAPDTAVGRKGTPNQVDFGAEPVDASTIDHGLDSPVPNSEIKAYEDAKRMGLQGVIDPRLQATSGTTELLLLRREKRVADLYTTTAWDANQDLGATPQDQWSDPDIDPRDLIDDLRANLLMDINVGIISKPLYRTLRRNKVLNLAYYGPRLNDSGARLSVAALAEVLELENLYVGAAKIDLAGKGSAVNMDNCWGNHFIGLYRNMLATPQYGITAAFTAQWGVRESGEVFDPDMGVRGGIKCRVFESVREVVTSTKLGMIIRNCI